MQRASRDDAVMRITTSLPILFVLISTPLSSRADEACESWFCGETKPAEPPKPEDPPTVDPESISKLKGADASVELEDGSVLRGVIVEVALDHLTVAVGPTKVTLAWGQVVAVRVIPTTTEAPTKAAPKQAPKPEAPSDASEESAEEAPAEPGEASPPVLVEAPAYYEVIEREKPAFAPGLFALGARVKLVGAVDGSRFSRGSAAVSDYVAGGVGYEVSFAMRLTGALLLRAAYEHADLFRGDRNFAVTASPTSDAVGIGVRWLFGGAPDVRGIFEAGIGYRWLTVPYADGAAPDFTRRLPGSGVATYEGAESLRFAIGTAFVADEHSRFELLVEGSLGRFTTVNDDHAAKATRTLADSATASHAFLGIALGLELGP